MTTTCRQEPGLPPGLEGRLRPGGTLLVAGPVAADLDVTALPIDLQVHQHLGAPTALPLGDAAVDAVWAPLALDGLDRGDAVTAARELWRVLRADAPALLTGSRSHTDALALEALLFAAGFGIDDVTDDGLVVTIAAHA